MKYKISKALSIAKNKDSIEHLYNSYTGGSLKHDSMTRELLEELCVDSNIKAFSEAREILKQELSYRGILVPINVSDEATYWRELHPFVQLPISFFNLPRKKIDSLDSQSKWCMFGVPYDSAAAKPGSRYGADLLRQKSYACSFRGHQDKSSTFLNISNNKIDKFSDTAIDLGNIHANAHMSASQITDNISKVIEKITVSNRPLMIGGDHSLTFGVLKGLNKKFPKGANLHYVHIDQHTDIELWSEQGLGEGSLGELKHSNFVSHAHHLMPEMNITQIGPRRWQSVYNSDSEQIKNKINSKFKFIDDMDLMISETATIIEKLPSNENVYISIDVDVFSSAFIKQTGYPSSMGIDLSKFFKILTHLLKNNNVQGLDLVEFGSSSNFDEHQIPADFLCHVLSYVLGIRL